MFTVKAVNDDGSVIIASNVETIEDARALGHIAFKTAQIDDSDIIQIWNNADEITAVEEFCIDDL